MELLKIIMWVKKHLKLTLTIAATLVITTLGLLTWNLSARNAKLREQLDIAQDNIEAYQGYLQDSQQANNVLRLDINKLSDYNDKLLHQIDSVRKENKIKSKEVTTAATQTQTLNVNKSKGVRGDIITILKDSVYTDSLQYNDLTKVIYTIGKDTVNIGIDLKNTQYLFIYKHKEYKNKKSFLKRLFTFDWKKVTKTKYLIKNSNDLLKSEDVRIVESNE